ncbi:hypothetical protein [Yinghuangia seranimata]|uniref:hypothetical protein n=1 Tax=Yinghuangia seranimata TaxID=408067 RepID=UPI00248AE8D7|nr:hypothetical protein [Yinghuangia seranimata]MDI2128599.1 hypothetical protein [Yinghuangia seranimata]
MAQAGRTARLGAAICVLVFALLATTGCVTVDGKHAKVAPLGKAEAARVLADFDARNNEAFGKRDANVNAAIETGSFGAIDQAALHIADFTDPRRTRQYQPFTHAQPEFWIPATVGWPKWFAARNTPSYPKAHNQLLVFTKAGPDAPWMAAWGATLASETDTFPEPMRDGKGHVEALPLDAGGYSVGPKDLAGTFTKYLADGKTSADLITANTIVTKLRQTREEPVQDGFIRQVVDSPAQQYPPLAIRLKDGSALVLFAVTHSTKVTVPGTLGDLDGNVQAFLAKKPKQTYTKHELASYAAVVPPTGKGQVQVIGVMSGVIGADGD